MKDLQEEIAKFAEKRNWDQYHDPKELLLGIVEEVGEFRNIIKWELNKEKIKEIIKKNFEEVEDTFGDMLWFICLLANRCGVDLETALKKVIKKNERRFPLNETVDKHTNVLAGGVDKK